MADAAMVMNWEGPKVQRRHLRSEGSQVNPRGSLRPGNNVASKQGKLEEILGPGLQRELSPSQRPNTAERLAARVAASARLAREAADRSSYESAAADARTHRNIVRKELPRTPLKQASAEDPKLMPHLSPDAALGTARTKAALLESGINASEVIEKEAKAFYRKDDFTAAAISYHDALLNTPQDPSLRQGFSRMVERIRVAEHANGELALQLRNARLARRKPNMTIRTIERKAEEVDEDIEEILYRVRERMGIKPDWDVLREERALRKILKSNRDKLLALFRYYANQVFLLPNEAIHKFTPARADELKSSVRSEGVLPLANQSWAGAASLGGHVRAVSTPGHDAVRAGDMSKSRRGSAAGPSPLRMPGEELQRSFSSLGHRGGPGEREHEEEEEEQEGARGRPKGPPGIGEQMFTRDLWRFAKDSKICGGKGGLQLAQLCRAFELHRESVGWFVEHDRDGRRQDTCYAAVIASLGIHTGKGRAGTAGHGGEGGSTDVDSTTMDRGRRGTDASVGSFFGSDDYHSPAAVEDEDEGDGPASHGWHEGGRGSGSLHRVVLEATADRPAYQLAALRTGPFHTLAWVDFLDMLIRLAAIKCTNLSKPSEQLQSVLLKDVYPNAGRPLADKFFAFLQKPEVYTLFNSHRRRLMLVYDHYVGIQESLVNRGFRDEDDEGDGDGGAALPSAGGGSVLENCTVLFEGRPITSPDIKGVLNLNGLLEFVKDMAFVTPGKLTWKQLMALFYRACPYDSGFPRIHTANTKVEIILDEFWAFLALICWELRTVDADISKFHEAMDAFLKRDLYPTAIKKVHIKMT
eukprot:jgi/Mesvir1/20710/Mv14906-RA.1